MPEPARVNTPSPAKTPVAPPVTSFEDRLRAIREDVGWLWGDIVGSIEDDVPVLRSDIQKLFEDAGDGGDQVEEALREALDAVTWLNNALDNINGEFRSLSDHLSDAAESLNNSD